MRMWLSGPFFRLFITDASCRVVVVVVLRLWFLRSLCGFRIIVISSRVLVVVVLWLWLLCGRVITSGFVHNCLFL